MIWITGSQGMLAQVLQAQLKHNHMDFIATSHQECDLTDYSSVEYFYRQHKPTFIFNCAAFTNVDLANQQQMQALSNNTVSARNLGLIADNAHTKIIHFSSDYVFDGQKEYPYIEEDIPSPINFYGYTKRLSESILSSYGNTLIIRLSWLYTVTQGFPLNILLKAATTNCLSIIQDEVGSPTFLPMIARHIIFLSLSQHCGIFHCASEGYVGRLELATTVLNLAKDLNIIKEIPVIKALTAHDYRLLYPHAAPRPIFSALDSTKMKQALNVTEFGSWQSHLELFITHYQKNLHQHQKPSPLDL